MRTLLGTLLIAAMMPTLARAADSVATPSAAPVATQPADPNAAFDADLDKYKSVPQASYMTATAHCYSDTVLPRVIDKIGLDDATKAKALAAYDAWRAKVNPKNELRYKKLTALRNKLEAETDAGRKVALKAQIDSLHWPNLGEALADAMADLKGILSAEQLSKLETAARELVNAGMDQFMQHLIALYPDLTPDQMKQTNELIKSIKDETAKLSAGDLNGTTLIRARFQQDFRNKILTEAQRKIERIRE